MAHLAVNRIALVAAFFLLWELAPRLGLVSPLFVPAPSAVFVTIVDLWRHGELATHTRLSATRALFGFCVALVVGPTLGIVGSGWVPWLRAPIGPLLEIASQANPVVLFHVVVIFLGIGESPKVAIIAWLCTWPIAFGLMSGIQHVDADLLRVGRAFGLSRAALLVRVVLPSAAPSLFTGVRLAGGYAFIMLIAAEMMGASSGLGWFVVQSQEAYSSRRIFAGATIITALGLVTDVVLEWVEARVVRWSPAPDARRALVSGGSRIGEWTAADWLRSCSEE